MKKFWLILAFLVCLGSIIGGGIYWQHRVQQISQSSVKSSDSLTAGIQTNDVSGLPIVKQINRLPKSLRAAAFKAYKKSGQVQLAIVGDATVQTFAPLLQSSLDDTFGQSFFKVTPIDLGKTTSLQFNKEKIGKIFQGINGNPDGVIFIPLVYNDDHQVSTDDTETVSALFRGEVQDKFPHAAFFVSLPNHSPAYPYLSDRIDTVASYVKKKNIAVIDGFSHIPGKTKLQSLVNSDGKTLSKSGQSLWIRNVGRSWGLKNN